jgi:hypothetical protein
LNYIDPRMDKEIYVGRNNLLIFPLNSSSRSDYKGLKKRVGAIRRERVEVTSSPHPVILQRSPGSNSKDAPGPTPLNKGTEPLQRSPTITISESARTGTPRDHKNLRSTPHRPYGSFGRTPPISGRPSHVSPTSPFSLPPAHETPEIMALPPPARSMSDIVVSSVFEK